MQPCASGVLAQSTFGCLEKPDRGCYKVALAILRIRVSFSEPGDALSAHPVDISDAADFDSSSDPNRQATRSFVRLWRARTLSVSTANERRNAPVDRTPAVEGPAIGRHRANRARSATRDVAVGSRPVRRGGGPAADRAAVRPCRLRDRADPRAATGRSSAPRLRAGCDSPRVERERASRGSAVAQPLLAPVVSPMATHSREPSRPAKMTRKFRPALADR